MQPINLGIIREAKVPPDKRVPFTPKQLEEIVDLFPEVNITVQHSNIRCFQDAEYSNLGFQIKQDLSHCNIIMGIKEVPIDMLIPEKTFLFFSHTIKKQPYNKKLLQAILEKKIRLIDYEVLKDRLGNRLVAFGRFAGIVGAYNGLWTYGKKTNSFSIRRAYECFDVNDLKLELRKVKLPPLKIILTGGGRVGKGAMETLDTAGIRKVNPHDFITRQFDEPVYVQLSSADYHTRKEGGHFVREEFHKHPERYVSHFMLFTKVADILMAGAYWNPQAPVLFTKEEMKSPAFKIQVIADITCDINGSIPSTIRATDIQNPVYDFDVENFTEIPPFSHANSVSVMAIDNLPCELPRSASEEFGRDLIDKILKPLLDKDEDGIIARATIAENGRLTQFYAYLEDYVRS